MQRVEMALAGLLAAWLAAGCGGGGGNDSGRSPEYDFSSALVAVGPIETDGGVVVQGLRYDTTETKVTFNGAAGLVDDLRRGHVVRLRGRIRRDGSAADELGVGPGTPATLRRIP